MLMRDGILQEIQALEKELSHLIRTDMTMDEKLKALESSYWRSHNAGYCDHIAGMLMGGIENEETKQHDLDCKYKWEVVRLSDMLMEVKRENIKEYCLTVKWSYEYNKEGTWFDDDSGEERYALTEGACYPLPHINKKSLCIRKVNNSNDTVRAELYVDYKTVTLCGVGKPQTVHVSDSYSVCGDCVSQSLCLNITIEKQ